VLLVHTERGNSVSRRVLFISLRISQLFSKDYSKAEGWHGLREAERGNLSIDRHQPQQTLSLEISYWTSDPGCFVGFISRFYWWLKAYPNPLSRKAVSPLPKNQTKLKQFLIHLGILYCSSQCNIKFALKLQPLTLRTIPRSPSPRLLCDQHSNISIQR
jgi:hypothetical protein